MEFTYKGLQAQLNKHIVTDEEVDKQIEQSSPMVTLASSRTVKWKLAKNLFPTEICFP